MPNAGASNMSIQPGGQPQIPAQPSPQQQPPQGAQNGPFPGASAAPQSGPDDAAKQMMLMEMLKKAASIPAAEAAITRFPRAAEE